MTRKIIHTTGWGCAQMPHNTIRVIEVDENNPPTLLKGEVEIDSFRDILDSRGFIHKAFISIFGNETIENAAYH